MWHTLDIHSHLRCALRLRCPRLRLLGRLCLSLGLSLSLSLRLRTSHQLDGECPNRLLSRLLTSRHQLRDDLLHHGRVHPRASLRGTAELGTSGTRRSEMLRLSHRHGGDSTHRRCLLLHDRRLLLG